MVLLKLSQAKFFTQVVVGIECLLVFNADLESEVIFFILQCCQLIRPKISTRKIQPGGKIRCLAIHEHFLTYLPVQQYNHSYRNHHSTWIRMFRTQLSFRNASKQLVDDANAF